MQFSSCQAKERIWQQCSYSYCNLADTFDCNRVYLLQRISPCSIIFQPDLRKCDYFRSWGFKLWFVGEKKHEGPPLKLTLRGMQADHVKTYKWDHTKFVSAFIPLRVSFRGGPSCFFLSIVLNLPTINSVLNLFMIYLVFLILCSCCSVQRCEF